MNILHGKNGGIYMETDSLNKQKGKLENQIRDAYGKLTYTETTHYKAYDRFNRYDAWAKWGQIILSGMSVTGAVAALVSDETCVKTITVVISVILFVLNAFLKNFRPLEIAGKHKKSADQLWSLREKYVSLLTDIPMMDIVGIVKKRDELQNATAAVYADSLGTDSADYSKAQKALKEGEEQFFSDMELDKMLPRHLRKSDEVDGYSNHRKSIK